MDCLGSKGMLMSYFRHRYRYNGEYGFDIYLDDHSDSLKDQVVLQ